MRLSGRIAVYVLVGLSVLVVVFPLLWMLAAALKTNAEIIDPQSSLIPAHLRWSNLSAAWEAAPFGRFFINTAIFSVVTTAGQILTGMLAGYASQCSTSRPSGCCSTWS
jgi:multiple sugar transport system permease protein